MIDNSNQIEFDDSPSMFQLVPTRESLEYIKHSSLKDLKISISSLFCDVIFKSAESDIMGRINLIRNKGQHDIEKELKRSNRFFTGTTNVNLKLIYDPNNYLIKRSLPQIDLSHDYLDFDFSLIESISIYRTRFTRMYYFSRECFEIRKQADEFKNYITAVFTINSKIYESLGATTSEPDYETIRKFFDRVSIKSTSLDKKSNIWTRTIRHKK